MRRRMVIWLTARRTSSLAWGRKCIETGVEAMCLILPLEIQEHNIAHEVRFIKRPVQLS